MFTINLNKYILNEIIPYLFVIIYLQIVNNDYIISYHYFALSIRI